MTKLAYVFSSLILISAILMASAQPAGPPPAADDKPVRIALDVTKDTKILIDGKSVPFAKFAVVLEFAANAFDVDEAIYKERKFSSLKLVTREKK